MSKRLRYDALLVRDLATELNARLAGTPLRAVNLDRASLTLHLLTGDALWRWSLHPLHGELMVLPPDGPAGNVLLPRSARIERVAARPDERILDVHVGNAGSAHGGVARRIVVELLTNQWNALALGDDDRLVHVLRPRVTGERRLETGERYAPPAAMTRAGAEAPLELESFATLVGSARPGTRAQAFVRGVAYASTLNARYVIGDADADPGDEGVDDDRVARAHRRYRALLTAPRQPCVLPAPNARQPYSFVLEREARPFPSLLDAFAAAAGPLPPDAEAAARAEAAELAAQQAAWAATKANRLRAQAMRAPAEAASLRRSADLLLAQLHRVERGAAAVTLDDFEGGTVTVELDRTAGAAQNATRMYAAARKRERAAARLPSLIEAATRDEARWRELARRIISGEAGLDEVARTLPKAGRRSRGDAPPARPYRVFRTSGGLEVRVGRGAKGNDALTLRHSHGNDFWLHARDVGGAHVILRWPDPRTNPPAADLAEAAALAALHSKARTSALVPVDYTRRKYVRKPRKSAPGRVIFERGKTLFVEPDSARAHEEERGEREQEGTD